MRIVAADGPCPIYAPATVIDDINVRKGRRQVLPRSLNNLGHYFQQTFMLMRFQLSSLRVFSDQELGTASFFFRPWVVCIYCAYLHFLLSHWYTLPTLEQCNHLDVTKHTLSISLDATLRRDFGSFVLVCFFRE
jgi:hypothetical protein